MTVLVSQFLILAVVICVAGSFLARYADALGEKLGLGRTLAGMLLLAFATSLPELAVDVGAVLIPAPNLAVGDLLGSSLINLLILAVLDTATRAPNRMLSKRAAAHALTGISSILLTGVVLISLLLSVPSGWTRPGWGSLAVGVAYLFCLRMIFVDQQYQRKSAEREHGTEVPAATTAIPLRKAVVGYLAATVAILATGPFLAHTADGLAVESGLGGTFVGTLFVALSTALPEIVTTWTAVRMGAIDLAVGNILGSNCFNMLILTVVDLFYAGDLLADVDAAHAITATAVIVVTSVALLGLLYRAEKKLWIIEYDAAVMILLIVGALLLVYKFSDPNTDSPAAHAKEQRPAHELRNSIRASSIIRAGERPVAEAAGFREMSKLAASPTNQHIARRGKEVLDIQPSPFRSGRLAFFFFAFLRDLAALHRKNDSGAVEPRWVPSVPSRRVGFQASACCRRPEGRTPTHHATSETAAVVAVRFVHHVARYWLASVLGNRRCRRNSPSRPKPACGVVLQFGSPRAR